MSMGIMVAEAVLFQYFIYNHGICDNREEIDTAGT